MALTVMLDVDGTLVDSNYLHTVAWWRACREHGVPATMAVLHRLVGMGGDQMVPALVGREMPELDEAHSRHYRGHLEEVPALPGASDLVAELHRRGAVLTVSTSSNREDLRILLGRIESSPLIDHVVTSEDVNETKPAPDLAVVALRVSDADPGSAVFVGDTGWDVEAAGRAGIPCVALRTGGWGSAELLEAGAVEVFADAADLLAHLDESIIGRRLRELPG